MPRKSKGKNRKTRKMREVLPTTSPPASPTNANICPQPSQSYRDPVASDSDSEIMSETDRNSLVSVTNSLTNSPQMRTNTYQSPSHNAYAPLEVQPMDTDEALNPLKRTRENETSDDSVTLPPHHRPSSIYFPESPLSNQQGTTFPTPQTRQLGDTSMNRDTAHSSHVSRDINTSADTTANDGIVTSTPTHPLLGLPHTSELHMSPELMVDKNVTGFLGTNPLIGMNPNTIHSWYHDIEGNKTLVYPHDASFLEDTKCQIAEKLELAIASHLGCLEVTVTTPTAIPGFESRNNENRRPWCYLLSDISGENKQTLLADGFVANQHACFHILPFDPPPLTISAASVTSPTTPNIAAR